MLPESPVRQEQASEGRYFCLFQLNNYACQQIFYRKMLCNDINKYYLLNE